MDAHSPHPTDRPPHPLAAELIGYLRSRAGASVLEVGRGSGRNTRALEAAGFRVVTLDDGAVAAAGLSTHALLHGTPSSIGALLARIASRLEPRAPFFVTFGSVHDARYGQGTRIEEYVFAPETGDEAGVAHAYFDAVRLRALLDTDWIVDSLDEVGVDAVAGRWAHQAQPLRDAVHWFARLRRKAQ